MSQKYTQTNIYTYMDKWHAYRGALHTQTHTRYNNLTISLHQIGR